MDQLGSTMRERTLEGYWWLPESPDTKIAGIVTYDEAAPRLRLLGAFRSSTETSPGSYEVKTVKRPAIILGECDGQYVTLTNCRQTRFSGKFGGPDGWRQELSAELMLVGILLDDPDEAYFDRIWISVDHALAWSNRTGLSEEMSGVGEGVDTMSYGWVQPPHLSATVDGAAIELRHDNSFGRRTYGDRTDATLGEHASFIVTVSEPQSARALIDAWVKPLQDLVTLAVDRACGAHDIAVIRLDPPGGDPARPVVVQAYLNPVFRARPDDQAVEAHQMLFTLADVTFEELLPAWFALQERLGVVTAMVLGQRYIERSFTETKLITAVAAAEGLHRRLRPDDVYVGDLEFEELRARLLQAATPAHEEWLAGRLFNEPVLKRRLRQLVKHLGNDVAKSFIPKTWNWANAATNARNALVHRFEAEAEQETDWGQVFFVAAMTSALVTLILLKELGLPDSHLQRIATTHSTFRWITEEGRRQAPELFGVEPASEEVTP